MTYETQTRATFEDIKKAQEKLRNQLDELEENNLCVEPEKRGDFFKLIADALLGFEYEKSCILYLPDKTDMEIQNVGEFIRYLVYNTNATLDYAFLRKYGKIKDVTVTMRDIWRELKFVIFSIYPEALAMSIRISKEQKKTSSGKGYYVGPRSNFGSEEES